MALLLSSLNCPVLHIVCISVCVRFVHEEDAGEYARLMAVTFFLNEASGGGIEDSSLLRVGLV